jgi:hypothetical protein
MQLSREIKMKKIKDIVLNIVIVLLCMQGISFISSVLSGEGKPSRRYDKPIELKDEFLLFECENREHPDEKLFFTLNNIYEDDSGKIFVDFTYRFEADKPISIESFDYMEGFAIEIVGPKGGRQREGALIRLESPNIETQYKLKSHISNNDSINATYVLDMSKTKLKGYHLDDLKFILAKDYILEPHRGSTLVEYIKI